MFVFIPPLHLREKIVIEEGSPCISRQESTRQGLWRNRIPHMTQRLMIIFLQSFLFPLFLLLLSLDLVSLDSPRVYSPPSSPSSFDHSADLTSVNEIDKFFLPCYPTWASSSEGRRRQSLLRKQCKNILGSSLSKSDKETNIKKEGNWSLLHKKQSHSCHKKRRETRSRELCCCCLFCLRSRLRIVNQSFGQSKWLSRPSLSCLCIRSLSPDVLLKKLVVLVDDAPEYHAFHKILEVAYDLQLLLKERRRRWGFIKNVSACLWSLSDIIRLFPPWNARCWVDKVVIIQETRDDGQTWGLLCNVTTVSSLNSPWVPCKILRECLRKHKKKDDIFLSDRLTSDYG